MQAANSSKEHDHLTASVNVLQRELERLNAEILYWKSETDKRKLQLGEHLLDDPSDPCDDSLWRGLVSRELEEMRAKVEQHPECTMTLIAELIRDKQECMVRRCRLLHCVAV